MLHTEVHGSFCYPRHFFTVAFFCYSLISYFTLLGFADQRFHLLAGAGCAGSLIIDEAFMLVIYAWAPHHICNTYVLKIQHHYPVQTHHYVLLSKKKQPLYFQC